MHHRRDLEAKLQAGLRKLLFDFPIDLGCTQPRLGRDPGLQRALDASRGEGACNVIRYASHVLEDAVPANHVIGQGHVLIVHVMQIVMHSGLSQGRMVDER
ncbi:hypothetical protein BV511_15025 [Methylorubrum extorquens]|nr:hypothetical protein BV511_15025 [Methylorubrum extorquens]